jgi:SAM-dependent methyltransferase
MADQVSGLLSPWLQQRRLRIVQPHLRGRILDFGCGSGELARFVPAHAYLGLDIDGPSLTAARQKFPHHRFVQSIPETETFDTIVMLAVLEHIPAPLELLKKLKPLLKAGGEILITTPHPWAEQFHRWGVTLRLFSPEAHQEHQSLLNRKHIEKIGAAAGFKIHHYRRFLLGFNQFLILEPFTMR